MKNYYKILEVEKDASIDEIKKSYKKLAKKWHPDINKDANAIDKFKEATEAFEVLSDNTKRSNYDNYGDPNHRQPFSAFNDSFFGQFFNHDTRSTHVSHIQTKCRISFLESIFGCKKELIFNRQDICTVCLGNGSKDGKNLKTCSTCHGNGHIDIRNGPFHVRQSCSTCLGVGSIVGILCTNCDGKKYTSYKYTYTINIPPGVSDKVRILVRDEGNQIEINNSNRSNVYCDIYVDSHDFLYRIQNDVYCNVPIYYWQAVLGDNVKVPVLQGGIKHFDLPPTTQHGTIFKVETTPIGNFNIVVNVEVPNSITDEYRKLLNQGRTLHSSNKVEAFNKQIIG